MLARHVLASRTLQVALTIVGMLLLALTLAYRWGGHLALERETDQLDRQLGLYAQSLRQHIDRYRTLPQVLALDPELLLGLSQPLDADRREALNRRLENANGVTRSSTLTLIDAHGTALAASNWRTPASNVGGDYSFRPYVKQGLRDGAGEFYGIGLTTGEPGYFLSQAVRHGSGTIAGLVVIKIDLDALENEWLASPDIVLVSDAHGVIFLASKPEWRYRALAELTPSGRAELEATQQYAGQPLQPIRTPDVILETEKPRTLRVADPALANPVIWQSRSLPGEGWRLHILHDATGVSAAARSAAIAAGGGVLTLSFLALLVSQRRRIAILKQRSREELESMLRQHARELRTAQDAVVEAAQRADSGLSRSLEHLPQGVVIIDADLRLVAWNWRYQELFRFPPELLRVGQPIEDLFRHNAQRGLLGPGSVDDAIERRMQHLRSGKPHQRESEKGDGTVLEIRGNPLPEGGFVTSYADITSYRNAARELRSLADALECRIAERTRALDQARHDAEVANRHKSRFVAAAVHDLLQPLNAARMFVASLRKDVASANGQQIADQVERSLAAQDAILTGLLDIARLESGNLAVQLRDFPLLDLLDEVGHQAAVIAQARGVSITVVPTRQVIRSDMDLLRRVLQNFVANAIRHTARGRVLLGCRRHQGALRLEVHDQGPGIPESQQSVIFEEFRRLDNGGMGDRGAGLGLAIVERIGRRLEHPIGMRSTLGKGSVFWVQVPLGDTHAADALRAPLEPAMTSQDSSTLAGCRVWCLNDIEEESAALAALLRSWGCELTYCGRTDGALAAGETLAAPQVLLLDLPHGPVDGLNGWRELCARWRAANAIEPSLILTPMDRGGSLRALADKNGWGYLPKPVRPPALRSLMTQMLVRRSG